MTAPAIVSVLTDQHRSDALGFLGTTPVQTPHLDRLAAEGVSFDTAWCPSPICQPSRVALLTERYPHEVGVTQNFQADLDPAWPTAPRALQQAGWSTASIGKTHYAASREADLGSEFSTGTAAYGFNHVVDEYDLHVHLTPGLRTPYMNHLEGAGHLAGYLAALETVRPFTPGHWDAAINPVPAGWTQSEFLTDAAIDWLDRSDPDQPLYFQLHYIQPHSPLLSTVAWNEVYADVPVPDSVPGEPAGAGAWGEHLASLRRRSRTAEMTTEGRARATRAYFALISEIDAGIGRVIAALERLGRWDRTWMVYSADHGEMLGDHRLMAKQTFYRSSVQVPAIVRPPTATSASGTRMASPISTLDLTATILDVGRADPIPDGRGVSLRSWVESGSGPVRPFVFSEIASDASDGALFGSVREGETRVTIEARSGVTSEVFDLAADPSEQHNLAGTPVGAALADRLRPCFDEVPGWIDQAGGSASSSSS